jgi:MoaA/NifB/PqqE/SkfB family radical SAM enzyme
MSLQILYRGPLSSCNYGCEYCPFAKRVESREELAVDETALARFSAWATSWTGGRLGLFFTPWGEALIRPWYQQTIARLSHLPHIDKLAIQTNLSGRLEWISDAVPERVGIWATYHPEWTERDRFVEKVLRLRARGVGVSVGVVGFRRFLGEIQALRAILPEDVYLWVNAVKRDERYAEDDILALEEVDPLFRLNLRAHPSRGERCRAGESVISVDGDGTVRRCHFIKQPIGNLYAPDFADALRPRACDNDACGCHIGYVHLEYLKLDEVFGGGLLERIPAELLWQRPAIAREAARDRLSLRVV